MVCRRQQARDSAIPCEVGARRSKMTRGFGRATDISEGRGGGHRAMPANVLWPGPAHFAGSLQAMFAWILKPEAMAQRERVEERFHERGPAPMKWEIAGAVQGIQGPGVSSMRSTSGWPSCWSVFLAGLSNFCDVHPGSVAVGSKLGARRLRCE